MNKLIKFLSASAFTMAVLLIFAGINQADAAGYMKIGDIKGESTDNEHKDWIIIESMSSPVAATSGRQHKPFSITKEIDKASPYLERAAATGQVFPEVIIEFEKKQGRSTSYLTYKLKDVIVTSYEASGSGSSAAVGETADVPIELIALSFSSMEKTKEKVTADKPERESDR